MHCEDHAHAGMKRSSIDVNLEIRFMRAVGSNVGRAMRAEDLLKRAMFLSGRKSRICPLLFL